MVIVIGEYGEYGTRLGKYLEMHWSGPLRIHSFTQPESFLLCKEQADCYLLGEDFMSELDGRLSPEIRERTVVLSHEEKTGCFCRYHAPAGLLDMVKRRQESMRPEQGNPVVPASVTVVFSPVFEGNLRHMVSSLMDEEALCLGMEDVGDVKDTGGNMGDLCYYIRIREEMIISRVQETAREENGRWFVDSSPVFYELLELSEEEYRWFFEKLRTEGMWRQIYVAAGSGIISHMVPLCDRLVLLDSRENHRDHVYCDYMERAILSRPGQPGGKYERKYREDVTNGAV